MDFVYCRLNFIFLFMDYLWPPFISTVTSYFSLYIVLISCALPLNFLPLPLFLVTAFVVLLFFPLKTQILRMIVP
jgi:hypothetical protein